MQSTEFSWDPAEFNELLAVNERDDAVQLSLTYLSDKSASILEAGCGSGRVVKYFHDLGYTNVRGIEVNAQAVRDLNVHFPELDVIQGDILDMPYEDDLFDVIVSYGVVEHFPELGPVPPLRALRRVLKPDGIAIVSVPSHNVVRRVSDISRRTVEFMRPRKNRWLRRVFGRTELQRPSNAFGYHVFPPTGPFFEYRLTRREFTDASEQAGFDVIESRPISHIDGLYHAFGTRLVKFEHWEFKASPAVLLLNRVLARIPYFHNHMQICVLRKSPG
jgi:SAM-dependent methyltransferase